MLNFVKIAIDLSKLRTGAQVLSIMQEIYYRFQDRRDAKKYHAEQEAKALEQQKQQQEQQQQKKSKKIKPTVPGPELKEGCQREVKKKKAKP
jgi:transcription initiation factor TFIID subunit TAF12